MQLFAQAKTKYAYAAALIALSLVVSSLARAQTADIAPQNPTTTPVQFFTIDEDNLETDTTTDHPELAPHNMSPLFFTGDLIKAARELLVNLLRWTLHEEIPPQPEEKYIRKLHFGRWINDPNDNTCMNTRARVLVRESNNQVTFRGNRQCVVEDGKWTDPYTNNEILSSRQIQIDHMVPLKNAYISGAWKWDYKTRCLYANYMGYKNHLVAASGRENMSKGDRGPEKYLPPALNYRCQYVRDWLAVKLIWKLNMTSAEVQAIHDTVKNYGCNMEQFRFTQAELSKQRQFIDDNIEFCMANRRVEEPQAPL